MTLLEAVVADPDQRLSQLPLLSEREREQVLVEWNRTQHDFAEPACVHQLFEAQVRARAGCRGLGVAMARP